MEKIFLAKPHGGDAETFRKNQYHGSWCPGSARRQQISSHGIDCLECVGHSSSKGRFFKSLDVYYTILKESNTLKS